MNEFSTFEDMLWDEAEQKTEERYKWNFYKGKKHKPNYYHGVKWEIFLTLIFEYLIKTLGLKDRLKIRHTPFTYRKYVSHEGRGVDIVVYIKKWNGTWLPLIYIEAKNWIQRFLSPSLFKTHVLQRFKNRIAPTKLLISKGVKYSVNVLNKLKNHSITLINKNYVNSVRDLIIDKIKQTNMTDKTNTTKTNITKSVEIHNTRKNAISPSPFLKIVYEPNMFCEMKNHDRGLV